MTWQTQIDHWTEAREALLRLRVEENMEMSNTESKIFDVASSICGEKIKAATMNLQHYGEPQ